MTSKTGKIKDNEKERQCDVSGICIEFYLLCSVSVLANVLFSYLSFSCF